MTNLRIRILAAAVLLVGAAATLWFWPASDGQAEAPTHRLSLQEGHVYRYAFDWRAEQHTRLAGAGDDGGLAGVAGELALDGELALAVYERVGERRYLVGASFASIGTHRVTVMGSDALPDVSPLVGPEALFELRDDGELRTIRFEQDAPPQFQDLMHGVLTQLRFRMGDGERWTLEEPGPHGLAEVAYARDADDPDMVRTRLRYLTITALPGHDPDGKDVELSATTSFDFEEGALASLEEEEELMVSVGREPQLTARTVFELHLQSVRPTEGTAPDLPEEVTRRIGEHRPDSDGARALLESRVDGLTIERLVNDVRYLGRDIPDFGRFLWRASGLLKLHPELCRHLVAVFEDPASSTEARALVLDLLTSAGHAEAQAVLRELLVSETALSDTEQYPYYLQRLSLLDAPEVETVELLAARVALEEEGSDRSAEGASLLALGSTTGHLAERDPQEAARFNRLLRDELAAEDDPVKREMRLRALGNTGLEENVDVILEHAGSEDATTRRATARALHKVTHRRDVRNTLLRLTEDADRDVQSTALHTLKDGPLEEADLSRIGAMVQEGEIDHLQDPTIVNLFARTHPPARIAVPTLQSILARRQNDPRLAARIRAILAEYGVTG